MQRFLTLLSLWLLLGTGNILANGPKVSFSADTLHACLGEVFELRPDISGGSAPYQYHWSTGDSDSVLFILPTQTYTSISLRLTDAQGLADTAEVVIHALDECVFPGDANGDGAANHIDIINLGIAYGNTGYVRPNAHLNWVGQPSHAWAHNFTNGVNYAHSDGDGNGTVNQDDILAIEHNYLAPNPLPGSISPSGIPLSVTFDASNAQPGDTVRAKITIGSPTQGVDSIYGIAFSLELEGYAIDSGSVEVNYDGSVLGTRAELLTIDKTFYNKEIIEVGVSRFDGNEVMAARGQVAEIIVVIDEIIGKKEGVDILNFNLKSVSLKNNAGAYLPVKPMGSTLSIITRNEDFSPKENVGIQRLPGKGWIVSLGPNHPGIESASLRALDGREVGKINFLNGRAFLPSGQLSHTVYILVLEGQNADYPIKLANY